MRLKLNCISASAQAHPHLLFVLGFFSDIDRRLHCWLSSTIWFETELFNGIIRNIFNWSGWKSHKTREYPLQFKINPLMSSSVRRSRMFKNLAFSLEYAIRWTITQIGLKFTPHIGFNERKSYRNLALILLIFCLQLIFSNSVTLKMGFMGCLYSDSFFRIKHEFKME